MALDIERLIKDLRGGAAEMLAGEDPVPDLMWGMSRAWLIMASSIEDGEYNLHPETRTIAEIDPEWDAPENVIPGQYDSDDLDRIAARRDREDT